MPQAPIKMGGHSSRTTFRELKLPLKDVASDLGLLDDVFEQAFKIVQRPAHEAKRQLFVVRHEDRRRKHRPHYVA